MSEAMTPDTVNTTRLLIHRAPFVAKRTVQPNAIAEPRDPPTSRNLTGDCCG
jgi:hypothetical protein